MALTSDTPPVIPHSATLPRQIKQVSLTYITQRYLWPAFVPFCPIAILMAVSSFRSRRGTPDAVTPLLFGIGIPMLTFLPFLVGLAKSQVAHSRARLVPRFWPAHLIVLAGTLLALTILLPLVAAWISGFAMLGMLAVAMAVGAPALWGSHLNRIGPMLAALVAFYSLLTGAGLNWWIIDSPKHYGIHFVIFIVGAFLIAAWIWRLSQLHEESDDYQNPYLWFLSRRIGGEAVEQRRIVAAQVRRNWLLGMVGDWWHTRLGGYYGGERAGLVRLLRYGFQPTPIEFQGLWFCMMVLCMGIFFTQFSLNSNNGAVSGGYFFIVPFATLIPGLLPGEMLAQRRPRTANELLLPLSRRQLIDGLFTAAARNAVTLWLMIHIAIAVVVAMADLSLTLRTIAMFLLLSATTTFATLGIGLRFSVWPSMAKRLFTIVLASNFVGGFLGWILRRNSLGDAQLITSAVVLVAIGIWAIRSARSAWLNLEFV